MRSFILAAERRFCSILFPRSTPSRSCAVVLGLLLAFSWGAEANQKREQRRGASPAKLEKAGPPRELLLAQASSRPRTQGRTTRSTAPAKKTEPDSAAAATGKENAAAAAPATDAAETGTAAAAAEESPASPSPDPAAAPSPETLYPAMASEPAPIDPATLPPAAGETSPAPALAPAPSGPEAAPALPGEPGFRATVPGLTGETPTEPSLLEVGLFPEGGVPFFMDPPPPQREQPDAIPLPPAKERTYTVGKITVKYGTDVRQRNPRLPSEEELANTAVNLLQIRRGFFHAPDPKGAAPESRDPDPALASKVPPTADAPAADGAKPAADAPKPVEQPKPEKKSRRKPAPKRSAAKPPLAKPAAEPQPVVFKPAESGEPKEMSAMALLDVYNGIVQQLVNRGLIGVYLLASIEPRTGVDARQGGSTDLEIQVFVSEVSKVRTIARRVPPKPGDLPKINDDDAPDGIPVKDPKHLWIKSKSPIFTADDPKGGLLEKPRLQDYLSRLNRFPGRRVDAAINASGETGKVILDYLIREQKPLFLYAQSANNGTESTGEWRHRVGLEYKQLANADDILRLEFITSDFSRYNAGFFSYELALDKPDKLKLRTYANYGKYSAEDVGFELAQFSGESWTLGAALTWTPLYWRGFPLDLTLGGEWLHVSVENSTFQEEASAQFILPYFGIGTERVTDRYTLALNTELQMSLGSNSQEDLDGLGRFDTDDDFFLLKWSALGSFFLEPLLFGKAWSDPDPTKWGKSTLAHEIVLSTRGQFAFGDKRLPPQIEFIAGGFNTVRGYPEAFSAGDTAVVGSLEYRLHIPRLFKPATAPQRAKKVKKGAKPAGGEAADAGPEQPPALATAMPSPGDRPDPRFNFRPSSIGGSADWDLIFRGFVDAGKTFNNNLQIGTEKDRTLLSVGAGIEIQFYKPLYIALRLDYGYVLLDESELLRDPVRAGDSRIHLSGTIAW